MTDAGHASQPDALSTAQILGPGAMALAVLVIAARRDEGRVQMAGCGYRPGGIQIDPQRIER